MGPNKVKISKFPQFYSKKTHLVRGFFTFQCFVFFLIFAFSCLSFSSFPLLLDFLKPKSGPPNEVVGIYIYMGASGLLARPWHHEGSLTPSPDSSRLFFGRRQRAPENATHPETQVVDRSQNLRFRVCCVFGCVLAPS